MIWDEKIALDYLQWENSAQGRFALDQKRRLLLKLCAPWRGNKSSLLEIGCGTGYFLRVFHEAGFDISGVDFSPPMLKRARSRIGVKADLHLGNAEYLQFEDNAFDFVLLLNVLEFCKHPEAVLTEAFRIAKKGIAITFLNRWSCSHLINRFTDQQRNRLQSLYAKAHYWSWPEMKRLLTRHIGEFDMAHASVLPGPYWTWQNRYLCRLLNARVYPLAWGAQCGVRITFSRKKPHTPILAWKVEPGLPYPKTNTLTSEFFKTPSCPAGIRIRPSAWSMVFNNPDLPDKGTAVGRSSPEH